jgi:hypothetical protein
MQPRAQRCLVGAPTRVDLRSRESHNNMSADRETELTLTPRSVARALGIAAALLVAISTAALLATSFAGRNPHEVRLAQLVYLDGERNLPTAFSTLMLLCAALLLALIALLERRRNSDGVPYWALLSAGFVAMGVDEAWSFHERLNEPVRALLGGRQLGVYYYAWVAPAIVFVALRGLVFARFLWRLPAATRTAFLIAAAVYLGGAVGIELIEGRFDEVHGDRNLVSGLIATLQETLEMAGVIVFIHALLTYLGASHGALHIRWR